LGVELFPRLHAIEDDGHIIKLARAIAVCSQVSKKFEDKPWAKIKGDDVWLKLMYLVLDSVEGKGSGQKEKWVRSAGFDEAWKASIAF
jgi:hypothetical protein